jgi:hypothetical protein
VSGLLIDLRSDPTPPVRGYYGVDRDPSTVTGVMLHRTACVLGERPERWKSVQAHIGLTMAGRVILAHDFRKLLWHGNKPSAWTIGIEIDGNPEGVPGKWWKPGGGPHPLTAAQVASAHEVLLPLLVDWFAAHSQWEFTLAHRQSSGDREYDPGHETWQRIALPWMAATGSTDGDLTWGTGTTIPWEWDARKAKL